MAEDRHEGGRPKDRRESQNDGDPIENGYEEEEPDFRFDENGTFCKATNMALQKLQMPSNLSA